MNPLLPASPTPPQSTAGPGPYITRRDLLRLGAAGLLAAGGEMRLPAPVRTAPRVPGPCTQVRRHQGKPVFFLDGKPYTKPVFETYVPETKSFRQVTEAGTDVFCFPTNLGNGFAQSTWQGPDQWDFSQLDEFARRVLKANPRGLLLPRIYCTTPEWWVEAHPEACQVLSNGARTYSKGVGHGRDAWTSTTPSPRSVWGRTCANSNTPFRRKKP